MAGSTNGSFWQAGERELILHIQLVPRAKRTEVVGVVNSALKIRVNAPPVDDKANNEVVRFVAQQLGVPRSAISIIRGHKSRSKTLLIAGRDLSPSSLIPSEA